MPETGLMSLLETGLLLADILLATVGILLAVGGVFGGIFGYFQLKKMVNEVAKQHCEKTIVDYFNKSNIGEMIKKRVEEEGDKVYYDVAFPEQGATTKGSENENK